MKATKRILTLDLIRVAAGTGRKVWLTPTAAKALDMDLSHDPVIIANHLHDADVPKGTLFLVPADGVTGWRIRSKTWDEGAQSDEFYAETAREMDLALSAATWALNVRDNHPTGTR